MSIYKGYVFLLKNRLCCDVLGVLVVVCLFKCFLRFFLGFLLGFGRFLVCFMGFFWDFVASSRGGL